MKIFFRDSGLLSLCLVALLICMSGCGPSETNPTKNEPPLEQPVREIQSESSLYTIKFEPSQEPIPFNQYFSLKVEIYTDEAMTKLAETVELQFEAEVVKLGAEMPTQPVIEQVSGGVFRIKGLLMHVPRRWELEFEITEAGLTDKAVAVVDPRRGFEKGVDPTGFFNDQEVSSILNMSPAGGPVLPDVASNAYADNPAAAHLGQFLFYDTRLSGNGQVACATCHAPGASFAGTERLATGIGKTGRHAPTILNAAFNRWQFWDGRTDSLWAQALQPLEADLEHGTDRMAIVHLIDDAAGYRNAYENIFGALADFSNLSRFPEHARPIFGDPSRPEHQAWMGMTAADRALVTQVYANLGKAIAAYERKLVSLNSEFDQFAQALREGSTEGMKVLNESEKRGLKLYLNQGNCDLCHNGAMLSNFEFHNLGIGPRDWLSGDDDGRYSGASGVLTEEFNAAGKFSDASEAKHPALHYLGTEQFVQKGAFKTPTLRNVGRTAPYMHGGQFATLTEVIKFYADLQEDPPVGRRDPLMQPFSTDPQQVTDLKAFLETLTGELLPESLKTQPDSPVYRQ